MAGKFGGDTGVFRLDSALMRLNKDGYGNNWSVNAKAKDLKKFGRNTDLAIGVKETLWETGANSETYLEPSDGNLIDTVTSSDASDVGEIIRIEGHYFDDDGDFIFSVQTVVLNGQNRVTLGQPLCRCSRMNEINTATLSGDIWVFQSTSTDTAGVPNNLALAHNIIKGTGGFRQSYKGATTMSSTDAFLITAITLSIQKKQSAVVDFGFEIAKLTSAGLGQTIDFLPLFGEETLNSTGQSALRLDLDPVITIPPNHDVRGVATSGAAGAQANITFSGYLALRDTV